MTTAEIRKLARANTKALMKAIAEKKVSPQAELFEGDEDEEVLSGELSKACDLLDQAMRMLGFFGDKKLSGDVSKGDRARMASLADDIKKFLSEFDVVEEV